MRRTLLDITYPPVRRDAPSDITMLTVHHLSKTYGIQPILQGVSFSIGAGERIGLIGPNGSGKTTLLRILVGLEGPDEGTVVYTRPNLLLLDEPTNHLDIAMLEWLESWLRRIKGAVMIVSHDRYFIERFASDVWTVKDGRVETW